MTFKKLFILFLCSIPLLLSVRVFQLTQMIDPETGFYYDMFSFAGTVIAAGIAALVLVFIILGRLSDEWPDRPPEGSRTLGVFSGVMALGLVPELWDFAKEGSQPVTVDYIQTRIGQGQRAQIASFSGNAAYLIFLIAAIVFFAFYAYEQFTGKKCPPLLSTAPILWAVLRLGRTFTMYTGLADISENTFDIVMLCLMLLFWLLHGRIISGYNARTSTKWIFGIGLSSALLAVICTVPRLYIQLFEDSITLHSSTTPRFINVISALYMCWFLFRFAYPAPAKKQADSGPVAAE